MKIRKVTTSEIDTAINLIWETFLQFEAPDYSDEGIQSFHDFIENKEMIKSLEFFGAYENNELKGVIATNDNRKHICCFFVRAKYHRQGIGRMLWEYLLNNSENMLFTVNSSPYAVSVYHKLGFIDTDTEQLSDGIRFTPMKFEKMIREAVIADLDSIEEMYHEHFFHEKEYGAYTVFREGIYPTRADAEKALRNQSLYVYVENDVVLGSIIINGQQPEEYKKIYWKSQASDEKVKVIHLLMVRPCMAGKGIGTALIDFAVNIAKQQSCIAVRLDTGEQNIPAVALYKKLGFQLAAASSMKVGGMISHNRHLFFEKIL